MLKRTGGLRRSGSLNKTSCLKNTKSLRASSNLKGNSTLQQRKGLCAKSTLKSGITQLKTNSYKRTSVPKMTGKSFAISRNERIQNQAVIDVCRRSTCEICGRPAGGEPHHIISRGAGGPDIPENLIQLCGTCHKKAHSGELDEMRILWTVAHRVKSTPSKLREYITDVKLNGLKDAISTKKAAT